MQEPGLNGREIEFIPDRLIEEPVVFRGLTDTEVVFLFIGGVAVWIPLCTVILSLFGHGLFGIGVGFGMAVLTLLLIGQYLQRLKRRMPDGLHIVYLKKAVQRKSSLFDFGYIERTGCWDIRRETQVFKKVSREE